MEDDLMDEEYYNESINIENLYFFFNTYFKEFFLYDETLEVLQVSYTMDNYQDSYFIDLFNLSCLFE